MNTISVRTWRRGKGEREEKSCREFVGRGTGWNWVGTVNMISEEQEKNHLKKTHAEYSQRNVLPVSRQVQSPMDPIKQSVTARPLCFNVTSTAIYGLNTHPADTLITDVIPTFNQGRKDKEYRSYDV